MNILLTGLPMPPSVNHCYVNNQKLGIRYKSKELKQFEQAMAQWRLENLSLCQEAKSELVAKFKTGQQFIRVDRYFIWRKDQLLNLDGTAKRIDPTNYIKCVDDALAGQILGLDDCWFSSGYCAKIIGDQPSVTLCLSLEYDLMLERELMAPGINYSCPWAVAFQRLTWEQYPATVKGEP